MLQIPAQLKKYIYSSMKYALFHGKNEVLTNDGQ